MSTPATEQDRLRLVDGEAEPEDPLPTVVTNHRQVRDVVADAWSALEASEFGARVFRYGDALVYARSVREGQVVLEPIDGPKLTALLNRSATWMRETEDGVRDSRVPQDAVRDMLALPHPDVPWLDAVVHLPVLRVDGEVATTGGYDPGARLLSTEPGVLTAASELTGTPQVREALAFLLDELLGDFPFARESDQAHALAALLLPVVRHLVDGPTPLHLVEAPTPGTGKTLLADVVHLVATGQPVEPTPLPRREEEVRKKITSVLLGSPAIVLLDNINHGIDSPSLAAVLTKDRWSDRVLGQSRMVRLPNRAMWLATANNPVLSHEISRRTVRIRLDADAERPWLRQGFRHPDLAGWVRSKRGEVVAALLELARGWLLAGRPSCGVRLGSYAAWTRVVGGVLVHAGVRGFLEDRHHDQEAEDPVEAEWRSLVALWSERFGTRAVLAKELLTVAAEAGLLELEPGVVDRRAKASFSRGLARRRDRIYDGWRITVVRDAHKKVNRYALDAGRTG